MNARRANSEYWDDVSHSLTWFPLKNWVYTYFRFLRVFDFIFSFLFFVFFFYIWFFFMPASLKKKKLKTQNQTKICTNFSIWLYGTCREFIQREKRTRTVFIIFYWNSVQLKINHRKKDAREERRETKYWMLFCTFCCVFSSLSNKNINSAFVQYQIGIVCY